MTLMSGADAILQQMLSNGVETIFGLPGGQLDHFFDSMYRESGARAVRGLSPRTGCRLHGVRLFPVHGQARRVHGGSWTRRAEHHRRIEYRVCNQCPGALPDRPDPERRDRARHRLPARAARSAGDHAIADAMGGTDHASGRRAVDRQRGVHADRQRSSRPGVDRDADGYDGHEGRRHAARASADARGPRDRHRPGRRRSANPGRRRAADDRDRRRCGRRVGRAARARNDAAGPGRVVPQRPRRDLGPAPPVAGSARRVRALEDSRRRARHRLPNGTTAASLEDGAGDEDHPRRHRCG